MFEEKNKTNLENLGEFGLIKHLTTGFNKNVPSTIEGPGDDAAVLDFGGENYVLISTDMLLEGVHFDLMYTPLKHLGYKAITTNISDIAAMNGKATQVLVSVGLSSKVTLEAIEEIYKGIQVACEEYKVDLIGGDTSSSRKGIVISITAIGQCEKSKLVRRSGANQGDLLVVSGDLGGAYTGLQILEREKQIFLENPKVQPDMSGKDYILQRQLRPEARIDVVEMLGTLEILPTSMMDISDGLSSELHHLAEKSTCGFVVYEDKLPIDPVTYQTARDLGLDPTVCATNGGEDYELLFTIPQTDYDKIKSHPDFSVIGYVTEQHEGVQLVSKSGNKYPLEAQGWKNFSVKNDE